MEKTLKQHALSLSYGKDSIACIGAIRELGWPLDRIVHCEVWATDTIPADLPPMVEFKVKADAVIKDLTGITVEHVRATRNYEEIFYRVRKKGNRIGEISGFPMQRNRLGGAWCNSQLKMPPLKKLERENIVYVGIAADEPNRFHVLSETKKSPLVEAGWTESDCRAWCEERGLLSPIYSSFSRGGCWFCHYQGVKPLRILRADYPDLWRLLLKWDADSPTKFHADGRTVRNFERRFAAEDAGLIDPKKPFRWSMLDET